MSKKSNYSVMLLLPASTHVEFEGPAGMSQEQVKDYMNKNNLWPNPSVCHQCSDEVQIDDSPNEVLEVHESDGF